MKSMYYVFVMVMALMVGCKTGKSFNAAETPGTAKWVVASFFDNINTGEYEKSLELFVTSPVTAGEISLEQYIGFVNQSLSNNKSITKIGLIEEAVEETTEQLKITVQITYGDGSEASKWVICQQVEGVWKMTTRGSMF